MDLEKVFNTLKSVKKKNDYIQNMKLSFLIWVTDRKKNAVEWFIVKDKIYCKKEKKKLRKRFYY